MAIKSALSVNLTSNKQVDYQVRCENEIKKQIKSGESSNMQFVVFQD